MTPRVWGNVGWGGGKEGGVSKEGEKVTGSDSWWKVKVLSPAPESLLRGRSPAVSPLMISSGCVPLPGAASMLPQTTPVCSTAHNRNSSKTR